MTLLATPIADVVWGRWPHESRQDCTPNPSPSSSSPSYGSTMGKLCIPVYRTGGEVEWMCWCIVLPPQGHTVRARSLPLTDSSSPSSSPPRWRLHWPGPQSERREGGGIWPGKPHPPANTHLLQMVRAHFWGLWGFLSTIGEKEIIFHENDCWKLYQRQCVVDGLQGVSTETTWFTARNTTALRNPRIHAQLMPNACMHAAFAMCLFFKRLDAGGGD